jgi:hypothetical protein
MLTVKFRTGERLVRLDERVLYLEGSGGREIAAESKLAQVFVLVRPALFH